MSSLPPYEKRAKEFGFASEREIQQALKDPNAYVLDVRNEKEIADSNIVPHRNWRQTACTPDACPLLQKVETCASLLPDRQAKILVYCRSGRRAVTAVETLRAQGYTGPIYNAGGYDDLKNQL